MPICTLTKGQYLPKMQTSFATHYPTLKKENSMRFFVSTLIALAIAVTPALAQQFQVGIRVGANISDFSLPQVPFGENSITGGNPMVGFETSLMARINILKHLYMQAEFEFSRPSYRLKYASPEHNRVVRLHANRVELPLMLGVKIGPINLFGGTFLRIAHNEKSSAPTLVKIEFNDSEVGLMGGLGFNIRNFFIEGRITGYPKSSVTTIIESNGIRQKVGVGRNIRYSLSTGIFF